MRVNIGTVTASGQISNTEDQIMVIEFHARSSNRDSAYVGMSDVTDIKGREVPPGEVFAMNFSLAYERDRRHPDIFFSAFYVELTGGDALDWAAIIR